jgi:hypothetical protein
MRTIEVETKGVKWLVREDGAIFSAGHTTSCQRERNGKRQVYTTVHKSKQLAICKANHGYLEVAVKISGKRIRATVHRLIGMAFVPGYAASLTINHINGIKTDNRVDNLEWVSLSRNTQHQWETGLVNLHGENHPSHKLTSKQVVYIRKLLAGGIPAHALAVIAGVSSSLIFLIRDGERRVHG